MRVENAHCGPIRRRWERKTAVAAFGGIPARRIHFRKSPWRAFLPSTVRLTIATILFLSAGCRDSKEPKKVRLKPFHTEDFRGKIHDDGAIRIAISPIISPMSSFLLYGGFIEYLKRHTGLDIRPILRKTYLEANELLKTGECDVAFICTGAYLKARSEFPLEILVVPVINGKMTYHSYIIVSKDSPARSLIDLKGRAFAFTDSLSLTGYYYVKYRLSVMRSTPNKFFGKTIFTGGHDNSIKAVAEGLVAAASVDSLVYDTLSRQKDPCSAKVAVIEKSPLFGMPPVVARSGLDAGIKHRLRAVMLGMHQNDEGKSVLRSISVDRFAPEPEGLYSRSERLMGKIGEIRK